MGAMRIDLSRQVNVIVDQQYRGMFVTQRKQGSSLRAAQCGAGGFIAILNN